ncbi:MAG: hypothetical protein GX938_09140 [Spirochaetales bacterium]|nr:hypothetical protein [Spirochaetales bacterium]
MKKLLLILNMNPGYDRTLTVSHPPLSPNIFVIEDSVAYAAGKGLNVARAFSNLDFEEYELINILGGNVGRLIEKQCVDDGIKFDSFKIAGTSRMNTTIHRTYADLIETFNEKGPTIQPKEVQEFIEFLQAKLASANGVVISGSAVPGLSADSLVQLFDQITNRRIPLYVDISGQWLKGLTQYPLSILKVNQHEFQESFQINPFDFEAVKTLKMTLGIETLVITLGKDGCLAWDTNHSLLQFDSIKADVEHANTVGCGDSFFAGLLFATLQGKNLHDACLYASACGVANTYSHKPTNFTAQTVQAILSNMDSPKRKQAQYAK